MSQFQVFKEQDSNNGVTEFCIASPEVFGSDSRSKSGKDFA